MRLGKREREALKVTKHARLAAKARSARVEDLPRSPCYTSMSNLALSLHVGNKARWEFSEKNDRLYTGKGRKV